MPSIFVFNIISKSKNLETDILSHFGTLKLDLKKPLPRKGFTVRGEASELICEKNSESILRFTYAKEEEKEFISLSGTKFTNRVKDYRAVWVDPLRQLLLIFTHDAGIAFNIVKEILSGRNCPFKLSTIKYELQFLKWLENPRNIKGTLLKEIVGLRATHLEEVDSVSDSLSFTTKSSIVGSKIHELIKNKGDRTYLRGIFQIRGELKASFYPLSKITIKKSRNMSLEEAKHSVGLIHEEIQKLYERWEAATTAKTAKVPEIPAY